MGGGGGSVGGLGGGLSGGDSLYLPIRVGSAQKGMSLRIDHSKFFSTFNMDKLKNQLEMNALKLVKLPCLKMICRKLTKL